MGAPPIFSVDTVRVEPLILLAVSGEVDASCSAELGTQLDAALAEHPGHVVLDLQDVSFIDSTGISALIGTQRRLNRSRRRVGLVCGQGTVCDALRGVGLTHHFEMHDSVQAAVNELAGAPLVGR